MPAVAHRSSSSLASPVTPTAPSTSPDLSRIVGRLGALISCGFLPFLPCYPLAYPLPELPAPLVRFPLNDWAVENHTGVPLRASPSDLLAMVGQVD